MEAELRGEGEGERMKGGEDASFTGMGAMMRPFDERRSSEA